MKTKINHAWVLTMNQEFQTYQNGYVVMEDGKIAEAGDGEGPCDVDETVDAGGGILMPGMINTHSHISMIPFRSMGDDCPDRLRKFLFPLELEAMTPELVYRGARYGICELLLAGVTTITDMYYFEEEVARACEEMGIRAWVGQTVIDQPACDAKDGREELARCEKFVKEWANHDRVHPMVAPHATNTNPPELLKEAYELAEKYQTLYTLHVSEMDYEMTMFREKYGRTPIEFLYDIGTLGPNTLAVHCIHATEKDVHLFAETGTKVAHCAGANIKAGKGIAPVKEMLDAGVVVGVGTDGPSSGNTLDLFTQFKLIAGLQKTRYHDRSAMPTQSIVAMGTRGGAAALGAETQIGTIEAGKRADLVLVETKSVNMFPVYNPYAALVYAANASNVDKVWVDGRLLVDGHRLVEVQLDRERDELMKQMPAFVRQAEKYADIL